MRSLARRRARHTTRQNGLHAVEQLLGDQRLEITALASDTVLGHVRDAGVQLVAQQHTRL
jgi:hypothetical protein